MKKVCYVQIPLQKDFKKKLGKRRRHVICLNQDYKLSVNTAKMILLVKHVENNFNFLLKLI